MGGEKKELDTLEPKPAETEVDVPLPPRSAPPDSSKTPALSLARDKDGETRQYGYKIIKFCFWVLVGIIALDNAIPVFFGKSPGGLNSEIVDLLKTIFLFVLGYLFGKNGDK